MIETRPWGYYKILEESTISKTKLIHINTYSRLSYQRHKERAEHWFIICGMALVTIEDEKHIMYPGESIDILEGIRHRIESLHQEVEFIEVQTGVYFGEDDIERFEDDYGRV